MKLSLATRIFIGYAVVLATFGAVSIFSVAELHKTQQEIRLVSQGYLHLSQDISMIETFHKNQERDTARLVDEKNVEIRRAVIRLARVYFPRLMADRIAAARERARTTLPLALDREADFIRDLDQRFGDLTVRYKQYEQVSNRVFTRFEQNAPDWDLALGEMGELKQLEGSIGRDLRVLHQTIETRIRMRVDGAEQRERRTGITILALSVLAIVVGLLVTALSARALRPVRTLIEGVSRIGRGDYTAKLGVQGHDEIAVLAREFDAMATSLQEREAQLKEKQQALVRAEKLAAVGRISAQVAHEVRNPLSSIGLNVELLEEGVARAQFASPEEGREVTHLLHAITREVDRLAEITEEYLRMARLPVPSIQPEDLNQLIERVLDFSRLELEEAMVVVTRRLSPGIPSALADEGQLRQVLLNLLRNSREAMPDGGTLSIASRARDGQVEIVVQDSGHGMSQEIRERIFEPFFTTKPAGTGLGLAVARQILVAHGGTLECESTPGVGTVFRLSLPQAEPASRLASA